MDVDDRRVAALYVRTPGPFSRKRVVPLSVVHSWSGEGPVIDARKLPRAREAAAALGEAEERLDDPIGWPVAASSGEKLGVICDLEFDGATGTVVRVEVSRGIVGDLSSGSMTFEAEDVERLARDGVVVRWDKPSGSTTAGRLTAMVARGAGKATAHAKMAAKRMIKAYRQRGSDGT